MNAIQSWTLLSPKPQIILMGDDPGTAEAAKAFGLEHEPDIRLNPYGTPLVNDLFLKAEQRSTTPILAYVNSDIILMNDFSAAVERIRALNRRFLLAGGRWDLNQTERLQFEPGWENALKEKVLREGRARGPSGIDYFVYPKGFWDEIPPFGLGRFSWDIWLLSKARTSKAWLIDASKIVMAVHQNHAYQHPGGERGMLWGPEAELNRKYFTESGGKFYLLSDATHRLTERGIRVSLSGVLRLSYLRTLLLRLWFNRLWFPILDQTRPLRRKLFSQKRKPETSDSKLTIFACPKAFEGHFGVIQWNAIRSWTLLSPKPEIILIGDDPGTAEIAEEFGVRHIPHLKRNRSGTPLLSDLFAIAEKEASNPILAYVNADIILMNDFMTSIERLEKLNKKFLLAGARWNLEIREKFSFEQGWDTDLKRRTLKEGTLQGPGGIDYFVFPRGFWGEVPPFSLGRGYWDNWLIYRARRLKAPTIDATQSIMAIHPYHVYSNEQKSMGELLQSPEGLENLNLIGGLKNCFTLNDATHRLTPQGIKRWLPGLLRHPAASRPALQWFEDWIWNPLLNLTRSLRRLEPDSR